jgi:hypothetical protein
MPLTDTERLDWLIEHKADLLHRTHWKGSCWLVTEHGIVFGDDPRSAIDKAMVELDPERFKHVG